jgi:hypothetical protein
MEKRYFPIKTETACRMKWSASTIYLTTGRTASCHRASGGNLTQENFWNFHNLPNKQQDRQSMLDGKWPGNGCEYCKNLENNNGYSDRNFQNTIPDVYPPELDVDPTLTAVVPAVLEIMFQNTCNLACVYCSERFSSQIERENEKFGGPIQKIEKNILSENKYTQLSPLLWDWLDKNFHKLQRLQVLGGEPLIQQDFNRLIEFIDTHPNPNLELNFITNLIVKEQNLINTMSALERLYNEKKIKTVDILCSVECWGPAQEYIRYGFQTDIFNKNFEFLLDKPWIRLGLLSTVNSLNIPTMYELAKKYQKWSSVKEIFWQPHLVLPNDSVLNPCAFEYTLWEPYLDKVDEYLTEDNFNATTTKNEFNGIRKLLQSSAGDSIMQDNLVNYLTEVDQRRNLNWKEVFPWLDQKVNHVV